MADYLPSRLFLPLNCRRLTLRPRRPVAIGIEKGVASDLGRSVTLRPSLLARVARAVEKQIAAAEACVAATATQAAAEVKYDRALHSVAKLHGAHSYPRRDAFLALVELGPEEEQVGPGPLRLEVGVLAKWKQLLDQIARAEVGALLARYALDRRTALSRSGAPERGAQRGKRCRSEAQPPGATGIGEQALL
jgi:hypothetical protein